MSTEVTAPMSGNIYEISVAVGDDVKAEDELLILEAMKMMNQIEADKAGTIGAVLVEDGEPIEYDQPLFTIV